MDFTAVILAGGKSSRMGRDKAFLPFLGKPLIEHALRVVRDAGAAEVLISGRPEQDFSTYDCPVLLDLEPDQGPLGGIERGLEAATHPLVLMLAVDLPHMTAPCLRWICGRRREEAENGDAVGRVPTRSATGSVPIRKGYLEPLVACYPKSAHAIVSALLREQRFAARDFAKRCAQEGLVQTTEVPAELEACFVNWNRPEDIPH